MIQERFAEGTSLFHRLDPRVKLIVATLFSIVIAPARTMDVFVLALPLALGLVLVARLPLGAVLKRLLVVNTFVFFLWVFLPFSMRGETIATLGPLSITKQGLSLALLITLKSNTIVLVLLALLATSSVAELGHAMRKLGVPTKLVALLLFTYRYLFETAREYSRLRRSAIIRCFVPKTNLHTYRTYANMVAMLLVRGFDRSERVYRAMICRGFHGQFHTLNTHRFTRTDAVAGICLFALTAACLYLEMK